MMIPHRLQAIARAGQLPADGGELTMYRGFLPFSPALPTRQTVLT